MPELPFQVVSIHGVPRSGTSWLGQVFASHPQVAYRLQPLFAYRFKDRLHPHSSPEEVLTFLRELYDVRDDPFILDEERKQALADFWARAEHNPQPTHLVMKMVRYHHLIPLFLTSVPDIRILGIVRHPCAVINSWLQAPKEFRPGWDPLEEWRYAAKKNAGRIEEYNGFEKWKEVAYMFLQLAESHPRQFRLVRYEQLIADPEREIEAIFAFAGLEMHPQTREFIHRSRSQHHPDPYAVVKRPERLDRWREELDPRIARAILEDLQGTPLEGFLT